MLPDYIKTIAPTKYVATHGLLNAILPPFNGAWSCELIIDGEKEQIGPFWANEKQVNILESCNWYTFSNEFEMKFRYSKQAALIIRIDTEGNGLHDERVFSVYHDLVCTTNERREGTYP